MTILHLAMTAPEPPLQAGIFIAQQEPSLTGSAPGGRFYAPGSPAVGERKSTPKRFCDGTLPQRLNPSQCHFSQKTALHVMYSYDQMYPWQYFTRRGSPLLSKSKSACPALLLRDFAQRYNPPRPCFYRKPPPNAMFSYDRMYLRQLFYAPGSLLLSKSKSACPALLRRFLLQRYNPPPCFLRKPSPNTMFSYDRMYPWQYFARRGSSLLSKNKRACLSAFATGFCYNATIRRSATFHRKPPCMPCTATTRCIRGSILRAGVPPCCQRAKAHAQRFCSGTLPSATIRRGPAFTESHPRMPCSATTRCIRGSILRAGASPRYQRAKNHTQAPLRQDFVATLQSAAARFPRKPPRHAMRSYDQMHPLSPIARHILPFSASLSAWEARCDRICVQGDGRSPIASSILFRRCGRFAQALRKSGVLLGISAANERKICKKLLSHKLRR